MNFELLKRICSDYLEGCAEEERLHKVLHVLTDVEPETKKVKSAWTAERKAKMIATRAAKKVKKGASCEPTHSINRPSKPQIL